MYVFIAHPGDAPHMWATKHYVWATRFQFLGAQVATKALKSMCSPATHIEKHISTKMPAKYLFVVRFSKFKFYRKLVHCSIHLELELNMCAKILPNQLSWVVMPTLPIRPICFSVNMINYPFFYHATFTLWQQHLIVWHYLDTERHDCIVICFHISFYASVAFCLHFSMSN